MTTLLYKFLDEQDGAVRSHYGQHEWQVGVWYKTAAKPLLCHEGFHASRTALQALNYVKGDVLATVEVRGDHVEDDNKEAWSEARLTAAYRWTARDSVALAVFAAELVLSLFEAAFPGDDRPRKAIEVAKAGDAAAAYGAAAYAAAAAATAAVAAYAASVFAVGDAAYAAAYAANAAYASSAGIAATFAVRSATAAADAAYAAYAGTTRIAAAAAADQAAVYAGGDMNVRARINDWIVARMPELETITGATP